MNEISDTVGVANYREALFEGEICIYLYVRIIESLIVYSMKMAGSGIWRGFEVCQ